MLKTPLHYVDRSKINLLLQPQLLIDVQFSINMHLSDAPSLRFSFSFFYACVDLTMKIITQIFDGSKGHT